MLLLLSFFLQKYITNTEMMNKSKEITTQADTVSPVEILLSSCSAELPLSVTGCVVWAGAVSMRAVTSILPSLCTAKAVSEVVKSTEHTATNSKHRYLHIFFRFISDKTCGV